MRPVRRVILYLLGSSALLIALLAAQFSIQITLPFSLTLTPSQAQALAAPAPPASPTPSRTPTPSRCGVCQLSVSSVTITCNPDGSVGWTATVRNGGTCSVTAGWNASLQVHLSSNPPGQFKTAAIQPGSSTFPAGASTTVSGRFCYAPPSNANNIKVQFDVDTS